MKSLMSARKCLVVALATAMILTGTRTTKAQAAGVTLVTDGVPQALLMVEAGAPKSMQAAEALQTYLERMSGAQLPLIIEGETLPDHAPAGRIHVGHTAAARGQKVPSGFDPSIRPDAFEEEGFVLRTLDANTLLVAGNNDGPYNGTVFAAYALLEELGCRWYFPGDWGEIVPKETTITVPAVDIESRPDFPVRSIWLSGWVHCTREERTIFSEWGPKMRFSEGMYPTVGDGFLARFLPPDDYFDEHPEWFAQGQDGVRRRGRSASHTMLCLSNAEMFEEFVNNVEKYLAADPERSGFGISPPDGMPYCYCEDCLAQSLNFQYPHYGRQRRMQSEEYYRFATRLARRFPDKWVSTMAYSLREMPPQGVAIPSNVRVHHAPITSDILHANDTQLWRRRQTVEIQKQFLEQTPHFTIYHYNPGFLLGKFVPERDVANAAVNLPMYREMGVKGMIQEGRKAFMQTWISYYVSSKLLWDADADADAIKQDFYSTFFGPAAGPHVQAWWDACERVLGESHTQAHEDSLVNHIYTKSFTDGIRKHVDAALAAESTEEQQKRVEAFALIAENLERYTAIHEAEQQLDYSAAVEAAERMIEIKVKLNDIYSFFISPNHRNWNMAGMVEGRRDTFARLASLRDGSKGTLVTDLPLEMRFARDPHNEGVVMRWYLPERDDSAWETRDTYFLLEQQEKPLDEAGFYPYGYVWYRAAFNVPAGLEGRDLTLYLGGIMNEGWVWVNGQFAGYQKHRLWWNHPHDAAFDVSGLIRPGEQNHIAVRVLNDPDEMGGLFRRGFLYAPQPDEQ